MTNDFLTQLTKVEKLKVIFADSILHNKDLQELRRLGKKHRVGYIFKGDVQHSQDQIRVTMKVIAVKDRSYVWAEVYDRNSGNILEIQRDIAKEVAKALKRKFFTES